MCFGYQISSRHLTEWKVAFIIYSSYSRFGLGVWLQYPCHRESWIINHSLLSLNPLISLQKILNLIGYWKALTNQICNLNPCTIANSNKLFKMLFMWCFFGCLDRFETTNMRHSLLYADKHCIDWKHNSNLWQPIYMYLLCGVYPSVNSN